MPRRFATIAELTRLAAPVIGLNLLTVLTLAVDTAMCGRLPDAERALSALGFAVQVVFLLMVTMIGLTIGTVALVARAHGAGDTARVDHVLAQSTQVTALLGIAVAVVGNLIAAPMIAALGAPPETVSTGVDYLRPLLSGTVFPYLVILYAAVLRGVGNTRLPFFVALAQNAVNVVLNYGLILGNLGLPALGVAGAATASVISQALGALALASMLRWGGIAGMRLSPKPRRFDRGLVRELVGVGAPAALDLVMINVAFLTIVGMLGRLSDVAVAAHGIGLRVQSVAFVPALSVAQAEAALVGQALGGGAIAGARRVTRAALLLAPAIASTLALAFVFGAGPIVAIFDVSAGTELADFTVLWIQLLGLGMPFTGMYVALGGLLQGAGKTGIGLRINAGTTLLLQIPGSYILGYPLGLGVFGVWLAFPLSFIAKAALAGLAYRRGSWAVTGIKVQ